MTNPYESPKSPFGPMESRPLTARVVGMFILGFLATMVLTIFGSGMAFAMVGPVARGVPDPVEMILIFLCSPAVVGPAISIILWRGTRMSSRPFAIGSIAFGVSAFLLMGGCLLTLASFA